MGTNLQRTSEKELLNKEYIWEPICIELEKKFLEQNKWVFICKELEKEV
jgi:hypothetical protein